MKDLLITVEQDHIESLTRANGVNALSELIWNSLDADATEIRINYIKNAIGKFEEFSIEDNGHALRYEAAEEVFKKIGGSNKKQQGISPKGRSFHGKEGKGRYKAFAIGDLVKFESTYSTNGTSSKFNIIIDRNELKKPKLDDLTKLAKKEPSKFKVSIFNISDKVANEITTQDGKRELEERFASYYISYPDFTIYINNQKLEFESLIKNTYQESFKIDESENLIYPVIIKIVEWNFDNKKKTYYCNLKGIPFREGNLGVRASLPISIFIQSLYIEKLHRENTLALGEMDPMLNLVYEEAKKIARKYLRERLHFYSKEFIEALKKENIYPYEGEAIEEVEKAKRQVFDIVALNVNEYLPDFNEQDKKTKQFTLRLIKEALENNSGSLQTILSEVIGLPDEKKEELKELLESTTLESIIDTISEINNRLNLINAIELLIYDPIHSQKIKERKHLHKILINETWIFGDEYTYGADDVTLKNVLKEYLKFLGREDYEEVVNEGDNSGLQTIPDVCLWKQFSLGRPDKFENLIIELKKPTVKGGSKELQQIQSYAQKIQKDPRFPKADTKWNFVLLVKEIEEEIEPQLTQQNREYGHVLESEHLNVWVLEWGQVIQKSRAKYKYVKDRLNITFKDNHSALDYLNAKYKQYLPDEFGK